MIPGWEQKIGVEQMLRRVCDDIRDDARDYVHIESGDLRDDIDSEANGDEGRVGSNLPYAATEEFRIGGRYSGSHSYLRKALYKRRTTR